AHDGSLHVHAHRHGGRGQSAHAHAIGRTRTPLQAYGIGLLHGIGGSAGVGVLLLATIRNHAVAVLALAVFASFTALSMALLSAGFGLTLARPKVQRWFHVLAPVLGGASL